ncbi:hypothetical protein HDV00_005252, partial [Rhizophlyctis rosea]
MYQRCWFAPCRKRETVSVQFYRCSRCRRLWYCSRECQRLDWAGHKADCNVWSRMVEEGRAVWALTFDDQGNVGGEGGGVGMVGSDKASIVSAGGSSYVTALETVPGREREREGRDSSSLHAGGGGYEEGKPPPSPSRGSSRSFSRSNTALPRPTSTPTLATQTTTPTTTPTLSRLPRMTSFAENLSRKYRNATVGGRRGSGWDLMNSDSPRVEDIVRPHSVAGHYGDGGDERDVRAMAVAAMGRSTTPTPGM